MTVSCRRRTALLAGALLPLTATGCFARPARTLRVAYPFWGEGDIVARQMTRAAAGFESRHPGWTVQLVPIPDKGGSFATKIELMQRSEESAPDVVYQDTVMTNADAQAGYLLPIDDYLRRWPQWKQFDETARTATRAVDGRLYGVLTGTDVRAVFYDKRVFAKAGLPVDWRPRTWQDLLDAARTIRRSDQDVIPLNVYATRALGETTTMQGLLMLLHGTDDDLYREAAGAWSGDSAGLRDSLAFVDTVFREKLGPSPQEAFNPSFGTLVGSELLPAGKLGIAVGEGSWSPKNWIESGAAPWPQWHRHLGFAAMPTRDGSDPGAVTLSGGWMLSVGTRSRQPELAFDFIAHAVDRANALEFAVQNAQIAVRRDVATDPRYLNAMPTNRFFTDLLEWTRFRPAQADYPVVSGWSRIAMESVMSGSATPGEAARAYAEGLRGDLGAEDVTDHD